MCVITTTVTTYPTSAAEFYACNPELLTGSETEGATPTFTADTATVVYALNLGTAIPPNGTKLVIHASAADGASATMADQFLRPRNRGGPTAVRRLRHRGRAFCGTARPLITRHWTGPAAAAVQLGSAAGAGL